MLSNGLLKLEICISGLLKLEICISGLLKLEICISGLLKLEICISDAIGIWIWEILRHFFNFLANWYRILLS
jgi:hypothetical protein